MTTTQSRFLNKEDRGRLKEILSVLRKHEVLKGLTPEKLRHVFEDLGPTFVKVGQLLSMRPELIPQAYCDELVNLRTDVAPMDFAEVRKIIKEELSLPFDEVFSSFEQVPIGSASIAQVHKAVLEDGREVAVKVQRPDIYRTMERDIRLIRRLDKLVKISEFGKVIDLNMVLDELWSTAQQELDFRIEADNLEEFARNNREIHYVCCPECLRNLSTSHLLIMEFEEGIQIDDLPVLKAHGYDLEEIGRKLVANYLKQILEDRFFQADPHPGNIYISGGRIVWLDMGMMGRVSEFDARCYKALLTSVIEHDYEALKDVVIMMGVSTERFDESQMVEDFQHFVGKYEKKALSEINLGQILNEALQLAASYKIRMPSGVTMVSRGIATLEGLLELISPDVSVISVLAVNHSQLLFEDLDLKTETLKFAKDLLYSGRDMVKIPSRLAALIDHAEKGKLRVKLEHVGLDEPSRLLFHLARKLIEGLVSAALIISAALFFQSTKPGSTLISMILLVAGLLLAAWTVFRNRQRKKKK